MNKLASNKLQDSQANENKKNQGMLNTVADNTGSGDIGKEVENLLTITKLANFKKPNITKYKMSNMVKSKKSDFPKAKHLNSTKVNSSGTDVFTLKAKKTFLDLCMTFTKAPVFQHFEPKYYIHIETNTFGFAIDCVPRQLTWNRSFSDYVTEKLLNSSKPIRKID